MLIVVELKPASLLAGTLSQLDQWLVDVLHLDYSPRQISVPDSDKALSYIEGFAERLAASLNLFFPLVHIPLFTPATVISVQRDVGHEDNYIAKLDIGDIGFFATAIYQFVIRLALAVCQKLSKTAVSPESRQEIFGIIETRLIQTVKNQIPGGKSTIPVLRAAHALDIPFMHLGAGVYQLGWGSKGRRMDRSTCELDSAIGARLSKSKVETARLLRLAGLPAPVHAVINRASDASTVADQLGYPLVIKPSDRDRGEGVTVDIEEPGQLEPAFETAQAISTSKHVIVERQVSGVCHRLFMANGKLLYAVKRWPMSVTGDGKRPVARLVDSELDRQRLLPPWERTELQPIDDLAIAAMARDGWTPDSIPPAGVLIPLRRIESTAWGGVDEDVSNRIHPENLAIAVQASELFNLHIAGIDIISTDISVPWFENGAIINEVNFAPLLGGGDISRRHIPAFLGEYIDGEGRIPVEEYSGEQAMAAARARQEEFNKKGHSCFITSAEQTIAPDGKNIVLPFSRLEERKKALLCRRGVEALIIVRP